MVSRVSPSELARRAILPSACLLVLGYFAYHAISGNTGLIAWQGYKIERAVAEAQASQVHADKVALSREVKLLDPAHVDPDYADELVRRNLGVIRPDEVIVPLPDTAPKGRSSDYRQPESR